MAIWIQSLSWTLICSLGQGFVVYTALRLVLKLMPEASPGLRYRLSLCALSALLVWFGSTWWQQFHALAGEASLPVQAGLYQILQQPDAAGLGTGSISSLSVWVWVNAALPWLSVLYLCGLTLMLARLSSGMLQLVSLRKSGLSRPGVLQEELLSTLKGRLRFGGRVQLFISAKVSVPMVIGFLKPVIMMPAAAMARLSTAELETILLHELAHIKRNDYLVNILQTLVETILFFNPFVWTISAIIRREREYCCDDLVLDHTREPLCYATALTALAHYGGNVSALAVAATGQSNHLFHRIKRIMEMKKNPFSYSRMVAAILIIGIITGTSVWLSPSFAHAAKDNVAGLATAAPAPGTGIMSAAGNQDELLLVRLLSKDRLVSEARGFVIEKKQGRLYIDGKEQAPEVAARYLPAIKKDAVRVQVFSLQERIKRHPGSSLLQLTAPVQMSSSCVEYEAPKPGC